MGKLKSASAKFIILFAAGIITGVLIGTTALSIVVSYRMDIQYKKITYLENLIQDKDARLEKLEESINTQEIIIKDIVIDLIFDGDEIDKIHIEKTIKEKYGKLLGKEVKNIDPDILIEVVDKRIFKIEEREYQLEVVKLILTYTFKLFVKVERKDMV